MSLLPYARNDILCASQLALDDALQNLERVRRHKPKVRDLSEELKNLRKNNHFADRLREAFERV